MNFRQSILILVFLLLAPSAYSSTVVNNDSLSNESDGKNWLGFGKTYSEKRFSPLTEVNSDNVGRLGLQLSLIHI